jgi:hypothetical protein
LLRYTFNQVFHFIPLVGCELVSLFLSNTHNDHYIQMNSASVIFILLTVAQARFGQEQIPIPAIAAVQGGEPGAAPTIAGAAISDLLAGSNACAKVIAVDRG